MKFGYSPQMLPQRLESRERCYLFMKWAETETKPKKIDNSLCKLPKSWRAEEPEDLGQGLNGANDEVYDDMRHHPRLVCIRGPKGRCRHRCPPSHRKNKHGRINLPHWEKQ